MLIRLPFSIIMPNTNLFFSYQFQVHSSLLNVSDTYMGIFNPNSTFCNKRDDIFLKMSTLLLGNYKK